MRKSAWLRLNERVFFIVNPKLFISYFFCSFKVLILRFACMGVICNCVHFASLRLFVDFFVIIGLVRFIILDF